MDWQQIWLLIGGLGMFLFGTMLFEEVIAFLVTKKFKNILKNATNKLIKAIGIGFFVTAVLQSSSVVSLVTVSFVGAGVIGFENAVGIILGTNIGAPLMDILLGNLGLKFSLSSIALPVIGIAGFFSLVFGSSKLKSIAKAFVGLGLIFLGLGFMKESMLVIASSVDLSQYLSLSIFAYFLIGFIVTLFMQSSSATIVLVLTAASSGIVDYRMGVPLIMGAFLGTTLTVVLGALGPNALKKQVAFSHVFFNLFSVLFGFLVFPGIVFVLNLGFSDVVIGLSVFAIGFKIIGVVLISPFVGYFTRFLQKLFPVKETSLDLALEQIDPSISDAVLIALKKDTIKLLKKSFVYVLHVWSIDEKLLLKSRLDIDQIVGYHKNFENDLLEQEYANIKMIEEAIIAFAAQAKKGFLDSDIRKIDDIFAVVSFSVASAKYIKDVSHNIASLQEVSSPWLYKQYLSFRSLTASLYKIISEVIDEKYFDEVLPRMLALVQEIKQADHLFLSSLSKEVAKEKMKKFDLSDVLHINRYVYLSSLSFVGAVTQMFLKASEKKIFEQLK